MSSGDRSRKKSLMAISTGDPRNSFGVVEKSAIALSGQLRDQLNDRSFLIPLNVKSLSNFYNDYHKKHR